MTAGPPMLEGLLEGLLAVLALLGALALLVRAGRALLRLLLNAAEATALSGMTEASARRGDLTTMLERQEAQGTVRGRRRRAAGALAGWLALLLGAPVAGVAQPVYALAALLWVVPRRRVPAPPAE